MRRARHRVRSDPARLGARMTEETERKITTEERERIVEGLRRQMADGRLDRQEYEERTRGLYDQPSVSPSPVPVATPPSVSPSTAGRPTRGAPLMTIPAFRIHFFLWLVFAVFLNVIWFGAALASGSWLPFWP